MWGIVFSRKAFYGMVRISDLFVLLGRVEGFFTCPLTTSFFPRQEQNLQSFSLSVDMGAPIGPKRKLRVEYIYYTIMASKCMLDAKTRARL